MKQIFYIKIKETIFFSGLALRIGQLLELGIILEGSLIKRVSPLPVRSWKSRSYGTTRIEKRVRPGLTLWRGGVLLF